MKKIGFVLSAPIKYSETFLANEFELLYQNGFEIILFEGYTTSKNKTRFKTIKSLPLSINSIHEIFYIISILSILLTLRLPTFFKFIHNEYKTNTGIIRILKRIWFNAHILNYKIDYLHFCFADVAIQKELVAKSIGAKMSVSLRGSDILIYPKKNKDCYNRLWKYVDKIHSVSNWIYENALELNLDKNKSNQIIYDFINTDAIEFTPSDIKSPIRIITVGRLVELKDHEFSVDLIQYLKSNGIDSHLFIVGDGHLRDSLEKKITKNNLSSQITLCGKLKHNEVLKLMSSCDFYIHASNSEGFNVSLLEAQATGLLTISLDSGSTNENMDDGKSGWVISKREISVMGDQLIDILNLPANKRLEIQLYARKRVEDKFSQNKKGLEWKNFFMLK